jgi:predicted ATPase
MRELRSTHILLLAAYRDVDPIPGRPLTETLAEVAREPVTRRVSLGGLSEREVAQYVNLTASQIASTPLVAAVHQETEGNPLFVGEIVRLLAVEGVGSESTVAIPQSVRDVIARRLTHLSHECNRLLVLAAVIGREFSVALLGRAAAVGEDALLAALEEAEEARLIGSVPETPGRLRFSHMLVRDALYDELSAARRLRLHREIGEALEALHGLRLEPHLTEIAHHFVRAGPAAAERVLDYSSRAGAYAMSLYGYEEAAEHFRRALDLLARSGVAPAGRECELLLSLGEALSRAGEESAAKETLARAAELAEEQRRPDLLARAAVAYGGRFSWARASSDPAFLPLLERAYALLGDDDRGMRVRVLARLSAARRDEECSERRVAAAQQAVTLARELEDDEAVAIALQALFNALEGAPIRTRHSG